MKKLVATFLVAVALIVSVATVTLSEKAQAATFTIQSDPGGGTRP